MNLKAMAPILVIFIGFAIVFWLIMRSEARRMERNPPRWTTPAPRARRPVDKSI